ncbi:MAG: fumarylacetoacetate hydrolase family protein, partial [Sulfolobales archaeon]
DFRSHSREASTPPPPEPYFFIKPSNSVIGKDDYIIIPKGLKRVDYEGEIAIIIGKRGKYIPESKALDYVFGFSIANDVSFRDYQFPERHPYGLNWVMGKALDTGLPLGPWIVTKDEVLEGYGEFKLEIKTFVNGKLVQHGSTEDMIFSIEKLISYLSQGITLEPGDVITTGTPAGVAEFSDKIYLKDGDVVEVEVSKIGKLRNFVRAEE